MAYVDLNDAVISQVRSAADIVDFVQQVTPLKLAGKSYKGLCPFHREKTPSFHVDRDKGLFYCFGCGTGGDVFKFLTLTERFTFPEAVEHVAARVGIELPKKRRSSQREAEKDAELREMAREEVTQLEAARTRAEQDIKILLLPKDPSDGKNAILEIRGGTGGDEAALFAGDLYRMYLRYAERQGWKVEVMSLSEGTAGGFKEVVALVNGKDVFSKMKFESGVHRVQRVPVTEQQGRIHTSAATVAVLPEAEEVDVKIEDKDLRIDVFRSGGPGGQSVNTTDSAVRVTHIPTGLEVKCQDQKSQLQNKIKALEILRSRLLDRMVAEQEAARARDRRAQVGTGDRSQKVRTYNFPQNRVTDHRVGLTLHKLPQVLEGDLDDLINALIAKDRAERLKADDDA